MPEDNATTDPGASTSSSPAPVDNTRRQTPDVYSEVSARISDASNVLIALSSDPSVDEMAAAIGLSLYLDRLGKRATAIYSGSTPNALEFLKPEDTFESSADALQDFVIALDKDKADHLRYKLDGDYVKIYITPYKTRIASSDLDFSYGDYNVDLVLALDVSNGVDLDAALREHGRIMHDATIVNITSGNPGKFGEIEWSDKTASSVSEMVARLLYNTKSDIKINKEEATAFLTGIVAATNRFSNAKTSPETMNIASLLMESGANQQLVSNNITPDVDNEMFSKDQTSQNVATEEIKDHEPDDEPVNPSGESNTPTASASASDVSDATNLSVQHTPEPQPDFSVESSAPSEDSQSASQSTEPAPTPADAKTSSSQDLMDDLKAAEASLASAGAEATPEIKTEPVVIDTNPPAQPSMSPNQFTEPSPSPDKFAEPSAPELQPNLPPVANSPMPAESVERKGEMVIQPPTDGALSISPDSSTNKYGQMLEDALAEITTPASTTPAPQPTSPIIGNIDANPAAINAPQVSPNPEINGVPEINYMPLPSDGVLPPPPAPPVNIGGTMNSGAQMPTPVLPTPAIAPATPSNEAVIAPVQPVATPQPVMQDQVYQPQATDPNAFKIPGM